MTGHPPNKALQVCESRARPRKIRLVAVRSPSDHIKTHMHVAKRLGATKKEILEVLEMCLPPAGLPAFMQGFAVWREVFDV